MARRKALTQTFTRSPKFTGSVADVTDAANGDVVAALVVVDVEDVSEVDNGMLDD